MFLVLLNMLNVGGLKQCYWYTVINQLLTKINGGKAVLLPKFLLLYLSERIKEQNKKTIFFNDSKVLIYMILLYRNNTWYIYIYVYHRSSLSDTKEPSLYWWRLNVENLDTWTLFNTQELSDLTSVLKPRDNSVLLLHESKVWKQNILFGSSRLSLHVYCWFILVNDFLEQAGTL